MAELKLLNNSIFWIPKESKDIHYQYIKREIFEILIYDYHLCPMPRRGGVVLDVGANIGMFAKYAAVYKNNKVISFEPSKICLEPLRKNLESCLDKVILIYKGTWSHTGKLGFKESEEFSGCNRIVSLPEESDYAIDVVTIDDTIEDIQSVSDLKYNSVDFIKMDVEGAEMESLIGAENTIKKYKPNMAISVYHKPNDEKEIIDYVKSLVDYKITVINHVNIGIKVAYFYN